VFLEQDCLIVGDGIIEARDRAHEPTSRSLSSIGGSKRCPHRAELHNHANVITSLNFSARLSRCLMKQSDRDLFTRSTKFHERDQKARIRSVIRWVEHDSLHRRCPSAMAATARSDCHATTPVRPAVASRDELAQETELHCANLNYDSPDSASSCASFLIRFSKLEIKNGRHPKNSHSTSTTTSATAFHMPEHNVVKFAERVVEARRRGDLHATKMNLSGC
jgi:hypothetical protein